MDARILIIDEEPSLGLTVVKILEQAHYSAVSVLRAEDGLASLQSNTYDLILLDIQRGDMDGMAFLHLLQDLSPGLKILILSSYSDERTIQKAYRAGASGYLIKPVDPHDLLQNIDAILNGRSHASPQK